MVKQIYIEAEEKEREGVYGEMRGQVEQLIT